MITTPICASNSLVANDTIGVETNPFAAITSMPLSANIAAAACKNISPPKRQSCPITTLGVPLLFLITHSAVAIATLSKLVTVYSLAIMALQPSVPNLILLIVYNLRLIQSDDRIACSILEDIKNNI